LSGTLPFPNSRRVAASLPTQISNWLGFLIFLSLCTGCGVNSGPLRVGGNDAGSSVTSVNIGLPDKSQLKNQVADIESKMNAYRLIIRPTDKSQAGCTNPTEIDQRGVYTAKPVISASLRQNCAYEIELHIGNHNSTLPPSSTEPSAVSFDSKIKGMIQQKCLPCHGPSGSNGDLTTYNQAKAQTILGRVTLGFGNPRLMPPSGPLPAADLAIYKKWSDGGFLQSSESQGTTGNSALSAVYYKNSTAYKIARSQIANQTSLKIKINLSLQPDGEKIGLKPGTTTGTSSTTGNTDSSPDTSQGSGGVSGSQEVSYANSRYFINAREDSTTANATKSYGLLILLHGSSASNYRNFINTMATVAAKHGLIPVSVLAPNGSGWNEGNQTSNAAFLNDLIQNKIYTSYNIDKRNIFFSGQSSGAGFLSSHFIPLHGNKYRGGAFMQCGASTPRVTFQPTQEMTQNFKMHFEITTGDGIWTTSFANAVPEYKRLGLSVTSDNTKFGGHCQFDQAAIVEQYIGNMKK
jgi:hypothetical protein